MKCEAVTSVAFSSAAAGAAAAGGCLLTAQHGTLLSAVTSLQEDARRSPTIVQAELPAAGPGGPGRF